nr:ribonuclease H-like domain-containing protein [Tanacetum cinerariifolium]
MIKLMNLINEAPLGNVQANMVGWIIDSGANQHMTVSTLNMFGVIDIFDLNLTVGHSNGTLAKIKYVGNLNLSNKIVWLGHPFDQAMLHQDLNFTKDSHVSPCDICHKAKQTREPFPLSDHQTTSIDDIAITRNDKSKKQFTLSWSSAEAEYKSMAFATCEVIWLSNLLSDMGVTGLLPVVMYCDNSLALKIATNPVFHEKSKHFEIDVNLVRKKVASGVIKTEKIHSSQQTVDILTKGLGFDQHKELCKKLGILDMFSLDKT